MPVDDRGKLFRTDDEHRFIGAGHDELLADLQGVDEAGARRLNVEGGRLERADLLLDQRRRGGKRHVRRDGGHDDELNLIAGDAALFHGPQGRLGPEIGSKFIRRRDPPLPDAGARGDPFVGGVHPLFEVRVGQDFLRNIGAHGNDGARAAHKAMLGSGVREIFFG